MPQPSSLSPSLEQLATDKRAAKISGMFDAIARRYDLLNHVLSGGLDYWWRARAVRALQLTGRERLLDVCTGTGDLGIAAVRSTGRGPRRVVGVDFAREMLRIAHAKTVQRGLSDVVNLAQADAMRLPVASASVDAVSVAFGIRNVESSPAACREMARVLRPGGRLAVLEFGLPSAPLLRDLYLWYFRNVLPRLGRLVSKHGDAYTYLPASVDAFPAPGEFARIVEEAGFDHVLARPLTFGVVYLYTATRRASATDASVVRAN